MVTSALTAFALRWRSIVRAFGGLTSIFNSKPKKQDLSAQIELPVRWFVFGVGAAGLS